MPRLMALYCVWGIAFILAVAVWESLRDWWAAWRAKRLRERMRRPIKTTSPPSSDEWWEKGGPPPEWESKSNGDDESREGHD